jgi:hypothetical protein
MQRIRPAIGTLASELGLEHALGSRRLYTDGAEVLYDYAQHAGDTPEATPLANWSWSATASGSSPRLWTST